MIFITGPKYSGKQDFICERLGWSPEEFSKKAVRDVEKHVRSGKSPEEIANSLKDFSVVIASETGCGIVPGDPELTKERENAGMLCRVLAGRADTVIRVICGIPQVLKGEMP